MYSLDRLLPCSGVFGSIRGEVQKHLVVFQTFEEGGHLSPDLVERGEILRSFPFDGGRLLSSHVLRQNVLNYYTEGLTTASGRSLGAFGLCNDDMFGVLAALSHPALPILRIRVKGDGFCATHAVNLLIHLESILARGPHNAVLPWLRNPFALTRSAALIE